MSTSDHLRLKVLLDLEAERMTCGEAASALGTSPRQVRTMRSRLPEDRLRPESSIAVVTERR